jgi:hypothetical protein
MADSNAKGAALERAVHAIEEMIIRSSPSLAKAPFKLEPNAIVNVAGVRHEIDLLVRVNGGTPYESLHIFECKNRQDAVNKNDVIILAAKVSAMGAARGALVAREFTQDASAQAKQFPSIALVPFTDEVWGPIGSLVMEVTSHEFTRFHVTVMRRSGTQERPAPEWEKSTCMFEGKVYLFPDLAHELANRWLVQSDALTRIPPGERHGTARPAWEFDPGELKIGDWEVANLVFDFDYRVVIRPARLVSTFSVEQRGRFARFECDRDATDGTEIAVEVLGRP